MTLLIEMGQVECYLKQRKNLKFGDSSILISFLFLRWLSVFLKAYLNVENQLVHYFVCSFTQEPNAIKCLGSMRVRQRHSSVLSAWQEIKEHVLQSTVTVGKNYYNAFCIFGNPAKMTISFVQTDLYRLHVVVTCEFHAIQHNHVRLALDSVFACLHFHPNFLKAVGTPT